MDLQKKLKEVNEEEKVKIPSTVNNALFVGSTSELSKLLITRVKKKTINQGEESRSNILLIP